jgi:DNA polymerase-1
VTTIEGAEALARELRQAGTFAFDTETTSTDAMKAGLVGLSFSTGPGHGRYVPVGHDGASQATLPEVLARLKPALEDASLRKTAHNANYDMTVLANHGVAVAGFEFDTMVAAHLLGRKAIGLKALALDVLGHEMTPITALIGTGRNQLSFSQVPLEAAAPYACADADMTGRLRQSFEPELRRHGLWDLFAQMEVPLVPVLVIVQRHGVYVDVEALRAMSRDLGQRLAALEQEIYQAVGHAFNINSPQQLGDVLFGQLQLAKTKRTRSGSYTTDASALEALKDANPVVKNVLAHRELSKLKSTYVDALPELVNPRTGRIHTSYNQTGAATGRVSSSEPNLQNIPVRTELGRQVRKAFVAQGAPEWTLLSALAHLLQDPALLAAFHRGEDIHRATASMMFDVPLDGVTPDQRRIAKILNFGVIYGLSAYGIAQQTEFSPEEGQRFIDSYFSKYPGIRAYLDATKAKVRREGYVETVLHRRRYVPEIEASNFNVRQAAERMAVNMPVQGTAADIMKLAMIRVQRRLEDARLRTRMILQVHDELVFELPLEEEPRLREIVLAEMPAALQLSVTLKVDIKTGASWGDME